MLENIAMTGENRIKAAVKNFHIVLKIRTTKKARKNNKYINQYIAYKASIAPERKPELALMIVIDTPQSRSDYEGTISAPVFNTIMESVLRHKNIKLDALVHWHIFIYINMK